MGQKPSQTKQKSSFTPPGPEITQDPPAPEPKNAEKGIGNPGPLSGSFLVFNFEDSTIQEMQML